MWDGKWHNASGTFDGSTVRLFIDGKEIGSGMPRGGAPIGYGTPAGNTTLGAYGGTCDLSLTGDLDEVSIWKKALPIAEIWKKAAFLLAAALSRDKLRSPRGCSSAGRASGWQPEGQGFEPPQLHRHEAVREGGLGR